MGGWLISITYEGKKLLKQADNNIWRLRKHYFLNQVLNLEKKKRQSNNKNKIMISAHYWDKIKFLFVNSQ